MSQFTRTPVRASTTDEDPFDSVRNIVVRVRGVAEPMSIDPHVLRSLHELDIEPIRSPRPHVDQPNFQGHHYHSGLRRHIGFDSRLEQQFLVATECDPTIVTIIEQPFRFEFRHDELDNHVPDFWVRHSTGETVFVNVKPAPKVADFQVLFNLVAELAAAVGIGSEVFTGTPRPERDTMDFLHRFRLHADNSDSFVLPERFTLRWAYEQHNPELVRMVLIALAQGSARSADATNPSLSDDTILVTEVAQ